MREEQRSLPHLDIGGPLTSTGRSPGPLTLRAEMEKALKLGDIEQAYSIESMSRFNWDRCMVRWKLNSDGSSSDWRHSPHMLPLSSRVHLTRRISLPESFHNRILSDLIQQQDSKLFRIYCDRPHYRRTEMESAATYIGRVKPVGALIWCAKNGMPTLNLMSGAMEQANLTNLLGLIEHLEKHPPANPHEIGLWMKKNPMPPWWSGSKGIEGRLTAIMFRPAPAKVETVVQKAASAAVKQSGDLELMPQ